MKNEIVLRPSYWASVSGGKDSLYMLYLILQHPERYKLDGVVHYELEIDYPFIKDVIDYMESECKKHGVKFVRIRPSVSYYDLLDQYGFPTRITKWCNQRYKLDALKQLRNFLKSKGEFLVSYIGFCYDEQERCNKKSNKNCVFPLIDYKINETEILEWAKTQPIFNDYYKYNRRCGCMYCPQANRLNMAYLLKYYPEHYEWMFKKCAEKEKMMEERYGRPFSVFNGNPKYNSKYVDKVVREKWIGKLEELRKQYEQNDT